MNRSIAAPCLGLVAVLCWSTGFAATVNLTPSVDDPGVGTDFFVTVSSPDMPTTTGATLGLTFNASVVSLDTAAGLGGATFIGPDFNYASTNGGFISLMSTSVAGVAGPFAAFTLSFRTIGVGNADIVLYEDGINLGWRDVNAGFIPGVVYSTVPVPPAVWLLATGCLGLFGWSRRSTA